MIHRRYRKISFLVTRLVPEVGPFGAAGVPRAFFRIDEIESVIVGLIKSNVIEDIELDFGTPVAGVGDAGRLEVLLRFLSDKPRIAAVGISGKRVANIANQAHRRQFGKRIEHHGIRIREKQHVALVNRLKATNARTVEADSIFKQVFTQFAGGD